MSCYIISDAHLDAIMQFCAKHTGPGVSQFRNMNDPQELTQIGRQLMQANCAAFRSRYEGRHAQDLPEEEYTYSEPKSAPVSPIAFIKLIDCLEYQCSDWPHWDASAYRNLLAGWQRKALHLMPGFTKGYDAAAWSL